MPSVDILSPWGEREKGKEKIMFGFEFTPTEAVLVGVLGTFVGAALILLLLALLD